MLALEQTLRNALRDNQPHIFTSSELKGLVITLKTKAGDDANAFDLSGTVKHVEVVKLHDSLVESINEERAVTLSVTQMELCACIYMIKLSNVPFDSYLKQGSPHVLDGLYDRTRDYLKSPDLVMKFQDTMVQEFVEEKDAEKFARALFFSCLQTVEILEERSSCLGRGMSMQEVYCIDRLVVQFASPGATEDNMAYTHYELDRIRNRRRDGYAWFSHRGIANVLADCCRIARPKTKWTPTKRAAVKYQYRPMRDILLEWRFDKKLNSAIKRKCGVTLSFEEACDLYAATRLTFQGQASLWIKPTEVGYSHPQVTALARLRNFLIHDNQEHLVIPPEETMALHMIMAYLFDCWAKTTHEDPAFNFVCDEHQKDIFRFYERINFFCDCLQETSDVLRTMADLLPGLKKTWKKVPRDLPIRVGDVYKEIEGVTRDLDDATKECNRLRKSLKSDTMKEKKIEEADAKLAAIRNEKTSQEEKLVANVSRLEYELAAAKTKLDNTRGEPDKIRTEFFDKIQRLHDKVATRDKTIAEKDNTIAEKDKTITEHEKLLKKYKAGAMKIKKDYDELKALRSSA